MSIDQKMLFRILLAALILQIISVAYYLYYVRFFGYLPAPFVLDKADTFMDLYNTLWWSAQDGRYTDWRSVYPPLNFTILDIVRGIFAPRGVESDPFHLRFTNLGPAFFVMALYALAPAFIATTGGWRVLSRTNRILVASVALLSPILLFSVERGNLLVFPLLVLPFVFAERDSGWKPLLLAVAINLKPYLAVLILAYAIIGSWHRLLQCLAFAGAIFLLTGLLQDPNFPLLLANLSGFANSAVLPLNQMIALPASPSALSHSIMIFLDETTGSYPHLAMLAAAIEAMKTAAMALGVCALVLRRRSVTLPEALALLLITIITTGVWAGGYSQIFYLAAIPVFFSMRLRNLYLALVLAIFLPWDLFILHSEPDHVVLSFISGRAVDPAWQIGLGTIVRPICNTMLVVSLAIEFIRRDKQVSRDANPVESAWHLLPAWHLVIPAGMIGLIAGAGLYWVAHPMPVATTVIRLANDRQTNDTAGFLTEMLQRRAPAQLLAEKLQTPEIAETIARRMEDGGLAQSLTGRQYGGNGALRTRLTSDASFIEISVTLPSQQASLHAATLAADVAIRLANASQGQAQETLPLHEPSILQPQNVADRQNRVFEAGQLVTPMIDRWEIGAAIGAIAVGAIAYAVGLSGRPQES